MPVEIPLEQLVLIPAARPLWPGEFAGLVARIEEKPDERTGWGVLADWCEATGEPGLARALRWAMKREAVTLAWRGAPPRMGGRLWWWAGLPRPLSVPTDVDRAEMDTPASAAADLAARLRSLDEVLT